MAMNFFNPAGRGDRDVFGAFTKSQQIAKQNQINELTSSIQEKVGTPGFNLAQSPEFQQLQVIDPGQASSIEASKFKTLQNILGLDEARTKRIFTDARIALASLDISPEMAVRSLTNRISIIKQTGGDPQDTMEVLDLIQSGDVKGARSLLNSVVEAGKTIPGVFPEQERGTFRFVETPTGIVRANTATGDFKSFTIGSKQEKEARKKADEQLKTELKDEEQVFKRADKLRSRFDKLSSDFVTVDSFLDRIKVAENNPQGDLTLIFSFMKILDPTSVVRESEQASAQNTTGVPDRIINLYNRMLKGDRLDPAQRKRFLSQAESIVNSARVKSKNLRKQTISLGNQFGVSEDQIFGKIQEEGAQLQQQTQPRRIRFDAQGNIIQ